MHLHIADYQRKLIVKRQISSISRRQLFRCDEAFANEIAAYTKVLPHLRRFSGNRLPYPKCLFAGFDDAEKEVIIFEDLCESGFEMEDRLKGLDYAHCSLVMKELGNLHAISLAMKATEPEVFETIRRNISEIVYCPEAREFISNTLECSLRDTLASLQASNGDKHLTEAIAKIERMQGSMYDIMSCHVLENEESWRVICHGDVWINNLMFRRRKSTGCAEQVKLVDLQTMRCTSPVIDILHFIYTSTVRDFRQTHLDQLITDYREALIKSLHIYLPAEDTLKRLQMQFTVDRIKEELHRKMLYGLGNAMWLMPAVTFHPNRIPDLNAVTITDFGNSTQMTQMVTPEYHRRIREMLLEFQEEGILQNL
uniref:CHK kinase-like domain-containing protein n=2 Tax=Lutzomyia longipalpis TaxID=7200 RepID=A0A1B0CSX9_LUTLO